MTPFPSSTVVFGAAQDECLTANTAYVTAPPSAEGFDFVGQHLLASYEECAPEKLLGFSELRAQMEKAIALTGATLLAVSDYIFPNGGYTALFLLAESHASIHTYPEHNSCFIDVFTCGTNCDPAKLDEYMRSYLQPECARAQTLPRGRAASP